MDFLALREVQIAGTVKALEACNVLTEGYGLTLSHAQALALAQRRVEALRATDRVEFGEGILKKLIFAFRSSPYLCQQNYEETLGELQDIFYHFKNESGESLTDDELIEFMRTTFDGKAQGSLEYLAGTALDRLCRELRGWEPDEDEPVEEDEDET